MSVVAVLPGETWHLRLRFVFWRLLLFSAGLTLSACGGSSAPPAESSAPAAAPAPTAGPLTAGWKATDGMATPESVYVDKDRVHFLVADRRRARRPRRQRPHREIAADGKVVSANWVTGLNAPKGLRSHNGTLWTADIDEVVGIDIASGKIDVAHENRRRACS